jgi:D-glycero-beta-D-manno-heptose-7-phosphate kinase
MKKYTDIMKKFQGKKILVLGDFILDEYLYGETERISREAPVLILKHSKSIYLAGGGANPIMNLKDLGCEPVPVSVVGEDKYSDIIVDLILQKGVAINHIIRDPNYILPVKTRIMAGSVHTVKQQIVRIDRYHEKKKQVFDENDLISRIEAASAETEAILVSDYDGGVISDKVIAAVNALAKKGKKVIVDSRYMLKKFTNITTATPNETEAGPLVSMEDYDDEDVEIMGEKLRKAIHARGMIITRGSKGMMVFDGKKCRKVAPFGSDDIVDVSGAGDTVSSIVAAALSCGAGLYDAAFLANIGGGLVVMKRGVATVTVAELTRALKHV